jgi:EmrB/QacA subfamily drug resistance transporter
VSVGGMRRENVIFIALMAGMLVAASSQTIISPALPVMVAELGGVDHYSWLPTAALLASAVTVPIVGKFSDMYGRRGFYIAGLAVFLLGSALAGAAQDFWWLVAARAVQGIGMGTIMPLSQTIIGDIISPRERGRYMGYMGAVFGFASVTGPLAGGLITDNASWRWLFYVNLPVGIAALAFIAMYLHPPQDRRPHEIDYFGFVSLGFGLTAVLLATSWGGTAYPWGSWQILGLYALGAAVLAAFVVNERRVADPVIPPGLWRNRIFTLSNVASMAVVMTLFGATIYIPVFAQGVIGMSVTSSGAVIVPLMLSMILVSIVVGRLITRTGRYKRFVLAGTLAIALGYLLLARLGAGSTQLELTLAMVVIGVGLGAVIQTYTLIVQNATSREELGVATATTQFFRSAGATLGISIFGTIMTGGMAREVPNHLPEGASAPQLSNGGGVGAVLDPAALAGLPPEVESGIREGMAAAMHPVFLAGIPLALLAFAATLFIRELPLKLTSFAAEAEKKRAEGKLLAAGTGLAALADEVEHANGDAPETLEAASRLVPAKPGESGRERARRAARQVIRPLADQVLLAATRARAPDRRPERPRVAGRA